MSKQLTYGSLFSGFGLMDLGFERAGIDCRWQVEINETAREVLTKNFPNVPKHTDVKTIGKHNLQKVNIVCGGFPCQDISISNKQGKGLEGAKSGLWFEFYRILRALRPRYALIENVTNLTNRGLERILCDLAASGYDAEWNVVSASDFGYAHQRERLFIFAHAASERFLLREIFDKKHFENFREKRSSRNRSKQTPVHIEAIGHTYIGIPERVRVVDGSSEKLDEIIRGLGNGVVVDVAEYVATQIIRFDKEK